MKQDITVGHAKITDLAYWINERTAIYVKRQRGEKWPWTQDPILQEWKFTNAFRQLDKGTVYLREMLQHGGPPDLMVWNIIWYRMFNWYEHAENLGFIDNPVQLAEYIRQCANEGKKIFTGAHMTTGVPFEDKSDSYIRAAEQAFERREEVVEACKGKLMEQAFNALLKFYMIGRFVSYEMVCDLRFTTLLDYATDRLTWANMGPGAQRGLMRLGLTPCETQEDGLDGMLFLYNELTEHHLSDEVLHLEWPFELREVEHSLCEFDKYQRVKTGAGRPRSRYKHGS